VGKIAEKAVCRSVFFFLEILPAGLRSDYKSNKNLSYFYQNRNSILQDKNDEDLFCFSCNQSSFFSSLGSHGQQTAIMKAIEKKFVRVGGWLSVINNENSLFVTVLHFLHL